MGRFDQDRKRTLAAIDCPQLFADAAIISGALQSCWAGMTRTKHVAVRSCGSIPVVRSPEQSRRSPAGAKNASGPTKEQLLRGCVMFIGNSVHALEPRET